VFDSLRDQLQTSLGTAYTLGRELGGGGMSRVFVAREEALGRDAVVKVLAPELAVGLSAERFAREIKLAAALQAPHIVPVLTAGVTAAGLPYYTMPFIAGESLRARISQGPMPRSEAVAVLRDVATALEYAHGRGLVHRDIKPENVLLSGRTAMVTDFGIAKALSVSQTHAPDGPAIGTLTQLGTSLGTPAYMAPEQAAGDAVDQRADTYAWGVIAFELLAGRHPFAGKTSAQQLLAAQIAEVPPPLGDVAPAVPPALATLVAACLAKDPAKRPASGGEVLAALESAHTDPHVEAVQTRAAPSVRTRALVGATLALLALAAATTLWRARASSTDGAAGPGVPPLVAVLPFETAGGAVGATPDTAFADGLGDAITGKLARLQGLRVIDRASVRTVEDAARRPQAAGRVLGAQYVLRATLRWARGADGQPRVQVSPVLVRVADGTTKWAGEPTVVTPSDPFAAQGMVAAAVAEALDVALAPTERARLARAPTADTAAFAAMELGRRLWARALGGTPTDRLQALHEFERAYQRDPKYADALGWAANALQVLAQSGAPPAFYDSAAILARRALALDPGQGEAVNALAVVELSRGRVDESIQMIERAARAFPSSARLQSLLATARLETGDSAGAVDAVSRAVALGPRSLDIVIDGARAMRMLRRYDDARDLLARARALEPEAPRVHFGEVNLARAVGDTAGVSAAVRALQVVGAARGAELLDMMRSGDAALQRELAGVSLASLNAPTAADSAMYYRLKAQLFLARGDAARARALMDSGFRVSVLHEPDYPTGSLDGVYTSRLVAWFAAGRGDRPAAAAALQRGAADPMVPGRPGGRSDADQTCTSAEVYGLLGDAEAMLPLLRRCLTMPNGYHLAQLGEPAFARFRTDPRMHALATELAEAQARARSTPARAGS
jgi:serine/threonine-protein kinase